MAGQLNSCSKMFDKIKNVNGLKFQFLKPPNFPNSYIMLSFSLIINPGKLSHHDKFIEPGNVKLCAELRIYSIFDPSVMYIMTMP